MELARDARVNRTDQAQQAMDLRGKESLRVVTRSLSMGLKRVPLICPLHTLHKLRAHTSERFKGG